MPKTTLIIVTFNARQYCEALFSGLEKDSKAGSCYQIIVVDNNSSDETVAWVKEHAPYVELIECKENTGFTGGNNIAMRKAIDAGAEYVVLLNQDMEIEPGFVDELVRVAESHQEAGAVQALVILSEHRGQINSWGNSIHFLGFGYAGGYRELVEHVGENVREISYASGSAVLYRVSLLKQIGLFADHFFMYQEDLDMGWRIRLAGFVSLLVPKAKVYHKYHWQGAAKKFAMVERNRFATIVMNYHWGTLLILLPAIIVAEAGLLFISFFTGWWRGKLKAYSLFFDTKYLIATFALRKKTQTLRKQTDRAVTNIFTPMIEFQEINNPIVRYILNPMFRLYWVSARFVMWW